jgi:cytochrome c6
MKYVLLPMALFLTMTAGFVASATGSTSLQNSSSGSGASTPVANYSRRCASCHGKDGRSNTVKGKMRSARDLTDPQWQSDVSDERLFNSIMNGRGRMPGFAKKLSEEEINYLVTYVRRLKK